MRIAWIRMAWFGGRSEGKVEAACPYPWWCLSEKHLRVWREGCPGVLLWMSPWYPGSHMGRDSALSILDRVWSRWRVPFLTSVRVFRTLTFKYWVTRFSLKLFTTNNTLVEGLEPRWIPLRGNLMHPRYMVSRNQSLLILPKVSPKQSRLGYLRQYMLTSEKRRWLRVPREVWFGPVF